VNPAASPPIARAAHPLHERALAGWRAFGARGSGLSRFECAFVRAAIAVLALHVIDDNYLQPEPGTRLVGHLTSGLVPMTVLVLVALVYPFLRAGVRTAVVMTVGALGVAFGIPAVYYLTHGGASGDDFSGLAALATGLLLLLYGPWPMWAARRSGGSRRRRYVRRAGIAVAIPMIAIAIIWFVVFPIGFPYVYTHTGSTASTPHLGVPSERVKIPTADSLQLDGWYVPSKNRAAVVVYPGPARADEARMLIRHGYGVLLVEPRGQGRSEGDSIRWAGDRDLLAAAAFLQRRPDVDSDRIGGFGFSVGGELLLEAAAQSSAFKAVVSEGAGGRVGDEDISGPFRALAEANLAIMTAALTVFANHGPPPEIVGRIGRIAPRPLFLIYADPGMGGEDTRQPKYFAAAGAPKTMWRVPGAKHTGGIDAQPKEYERRVVGFLDRSLLG
jgi:hypothetical protein